MKRRNFLKLAGSVGLASALPLSFRTANAAALHTGPILLTINTGGGWDHSSFSDPRENPTINHWADTQQAGTAGNLRYAPLAENAAFFNKYFSHLLIINGIDIQSNGHSSAERHRNTGDLMEGSKPSLNELYAAAVAPQVPMPFIRAGGYSGSVGIMPFTTLPDENLLRTLANPNFDRGDRTVYSPAHLDILHKYQNQRLTAQREKSENLPRWQQKLDELNQARVGTEDINTLTSILPDTFDNTDLQGDTRNAIQGYHLFLVLAAAGLTATGLFSTGGWDSHSNHDTRHINTLTNLTRILDYIWTKAETLGIADRLIIHGTSDVARTPHYNTNDGKDHWSVGADYIMMKNAPWANRIVGASGPGHQRLKINPTTLQIDPTNGIELRPKHIHTELRKLLGIDQHTLAQRYPLNVTPQQIFALLDPDVSTGIQV